jgi:ribosomal protein S18 acetylase RimI-like enzyme
MKLVEADIGHVRSLMTWFPDAPSVAIWGGPNFRFPFDEESFLKDMRWDDLASRALVDDAGELAAFGQYYDRIGRCHLGRLAVRPDRRGGGIGETLVRLMCAEGCRALNVTECSLFVYETNVRAVRLYERLGFQPTPYPEPSPDFDGIVYMTVALASLE